MRPLHRQTTRQVPHGCLRSIIWRLRLRYIDNCSGHTPDKDHSTRRLTLDEVLRDADGEEICAVDIDAPELADPLDGVVDGLEVLGEAGGGDEVVDFAVLGDNFCDSGFDGFLRRDVGVVGSYFGDSGVL